MGSGPRAPSSESFTRNSLFFGHDMYSSYLDITVSSVAKVPTLYVSVDSFGQNKNFVGNENGKSWIGFNIIHTCCSTMVNYPHMEGGDTVPRAQKLLTKTGL